MDNCCHSRVLLENKGEQPSPKSYDNSNARFSFPNVSIVYHIGDDEDVRTLLMICSGYPHMRSLRLHSILI